MQLQINIFRMLYIKMFLAYFVRDILCLIQNIRYSVNRTDSTHIVCRRLRFYCGVYQLPTFVVTNSFISYNLNVELVGHQASFLLHQGGHLTPVSAVCADFQPSRLGVAYKTVCVNCISR